MKTQGIETMIAEVNFSCGKSHLDVAGITVAMQGDACRDSSLPESVLPKIPEKEMASAFIWGKPAKDLPIKVVRFYRGDCWTTEMLEYVANKINQESSQQDHGVSRRFRSDRRVGMKFSEGLVSAMDHLGDYLLSILAGIALTLTVPLWFPIWLIVRLFRK